MNQPTSLSIRRILLSAIALCLLFAGVGVRGTRFSATSVAFAQPSTQSQQWEPAIRRTRRQIQSQPSKARNDSIHGQTEFRSLGVRR